MVVEIKNLYKTYKTMFRRYEALKGISFNVKEKEIVGFLGPNGAGKTTTLKILMGFLYSDKGNVSVFDGNIKNKNISKKIGYMPEFPRFYPHLNAKEHLFYMGKIYGLDSKVLKKRIDVLISLVGLYGKEHLYAKEYSKGMTQRLAMAIALLNDPDLLILDEPLSGLDPIGRKEIKDLILFQKDRGKSVLFSSHVLPDLESIADRIVFLKDGKIIKDESIFTILSGKMDKVEIKFRMKTKDDELLKLCSRYFIKDNLYVCIIEEENVLMKGNTFVQKVLTNGGKIIEYTPSRISLEEYFIKQIKEEDK